MFTFYYSLYCSLFQKKIENKSTQQLKQCKLFTPGPLSTTDRVKQSMLYDYGSRDKNFIKIIQEVRENLLDLCRVKKGEYESILLQGSGTYGIEATVGSVIPKNQHKFLIIINGAYGQRMAKIAQVLGINFIKKEYQDNQVVNPADIQQVLQANQDITHVGIIHSETTSGLLNPIEEVGQIVKGFNPNIIYIVDVVSSFAAYVINPKQCQIDFMVSTPNKNLQGIPGFAFVIAKTSELLKIQNNARSYAFDLYDQWKGLDSNGQFRFTPPTHVVRAAKEAMDEFKEQGGIQSRFNRYNTNQKLLTKLMTEIGFKLYIDQQYQSCIITTFMQPSNKEFIFTELYEELAAKNLVIYPGKLTVGESFRIGSIGEIYPEDIVEVVNGIKSYLKSKKIALPVSY